MTEKTNRTPEEMWADWARQELTDQAAELKDLRRFKREAEKELRRFKKYSGALEDEIKGLRFALEEIGNSPLAYGAIVKIAKQALKGGEE